MDRETARALMVADAQRLAEGLEVGYWPREAMNHFLETMQRLPSLLMERNADLVAWNAFLLAKNNMSFLAVEVALNALRWHLVRGTDPGAVETWTGNVAKLLEGGATARTPEAIHAMAHEKAWVPPKPDRVLTDGEIRKLEPMSRVGQLLVRHIGVSLYWIPNAADLETDYRMSPEARQRLIDDVCRALRLDPSAPEPRRVRTVDDLYRLTGWRDGPA